MLCALSDLGAQVYGVEPYGHLYLRSCGFRVFECLEEIPNSLRFDGIVSIDVIEHLSHPWRELNLLRKRLHESGWIYLATPNAGGAAATIKGPRWPEVGKPGHLVLFTPLSLRRTLASSGWVHVRRLRWRVRYSDNPFVRALHACVQAAGFDGQLRYLAFRGGDDREFATEAAAFVRPQRSRQTVGSDSAGILI